MQKDPAVGNKGGTAFPILKDLPSALPARELSLLKVRLGAWQLFRNLDIT